MNTKTARNISEQELSEHVINCLPGIFYLQDISGRYLRWNRNFEIASGYSSEEIRQMNPLDFFKAEHHERMTAVINKVFEAGYNETEAEVLRKDGEQVLFYLNGLSVT